jgi:hypothetical protein
MELYTHSWSGKRSMAGTPHHLYVFIHHCQWISFVLQLEFLYIIPQRQEKTSIPAKEGIDKCFADHNWNFLFGFNKCPAISGSY